MSDALDLAPAKWIWLPSQRTLPCTFVFFRREFDLSEVPDVVEGWIAADSRYLLYVNGERVQWGPAPHDPRHAEADPLPIKSILRPGRNCIAVHVLHYGRPEGTYPFGKPGLLLKLRLGSRELVTDASWTCQVDRSHAPGGPPRWYLRALQEVCDRRLIPMGWTAAGFNDESWLPAQEFSNPPSRSAAAGGYGAYDGDWWMMDSNKSTLTPRSIPLMNEEVINLGAPRAGHRLRWKGSPEDWFDFRTPGLYDIAPAPPSAAFPLEPGSAFALTYTLDKEVVGFPGVEVTAPAGTIVELICQESIDPQGDGWLDGHFYLWSRFVCHEGLNRIEAFDYEGLMHLQVHVRGDAGEAVVHRAFLRRREYSWPRQPEFQVSDPEVQKVLEANVQTLRNSCQDICVDGMARERQQYSGDCGHQHHFVRLAFGAPELSRRYLKTYAQGQQLDGVFCDSWPAADRLLRLWQRQMEVSGWGSVIDHSIGFVFDHFNHWMESGDLSIVESNWPSLTRFAQFLESRRIEGILNPTDTGFNSIWIDHLAFEKQEDKALALNLYASAMLLRAYAPLAQALRDESRSRWASELGSSILQAAAARWQMPDGVWQHRPDGRIDDRALATAVLYELGMPDPSAHAKLAGRPPGMGQSYPCNLPWNYWALARLGDVEACVDDLRERWAQMPSVVSNGTIQEMWDVALGSIHLMSHCSVGPLAVLYHGLMGLRPLAPGYAEYELSPSLGGLDWHQATAHTPQGPIYLRMNKEEVVVVAPPSGEGVLVVGGRRIPLAKGAETRHPLP